MLDTGKTRKRTYIGQEFQEVMELPNLVDIQLSSYERFLQRETLRNGQPLKEQGLEEVFQSVFPIESPNGDMLLEYTHYTLDEDAIKLTEQECKQKGISVHAVKVNWSLNGGMESKIVLTIFAMISGIERDLISSRTKEALAARKASGVRLGRPKGPGKSKLDPFREEIIALLRTGSTKTYISKRYGVSVPNLDNWLKKNGLNIQPDYSKG